MIQAWARSRSAKAFLACAGRSGTRARPIEALTKIGPTANDAVPAFIEKLNDPNEALWIRRSAAQAIGEIGCCVRDALQALREASQAPDENLRHTAQEALKKLQEKGNP